jgi:hypothetical protein
MTAFNAVRFKVKPGRDKEFLDAHRAEEAKWPGLRHANIIKTGDQTYCIIVEWDDENALANARPHMIATLNSFRDTLEDLGGGLGVTDPISGPVVLNLR